MIEFSMENTYRKSMPRPSPITLKRRKSIELLSVLVTAMFIAISMSLFWLSFKPIGHIEILSPVIGIFAGSFFAMMAVTGIDRTFAYKLTVDRAGLKTSGRLFSRRISWDKIHDIQLRRYGRLFKAEEITLIVDESQSFFERLRDGVWPNNSIPPGMEIEGAALETLLKQHWRSNSLRKQ